MTTHKFGVKLFFANQQDRGLTEFIPVFHGWIQRQALAGHLLIDVHDYSHVFHGPGILLVAHEANLSIDESEGRRGLAYVRKQPATLRETVEAAHAAARLLTEEQGVQFDAGQFEIFVNDRLHTPTVAEIAEATGGTVTQKQTDPRERLAFLVERG
jgi:hypothetical protein